MRSSAGLLGLLGLVFLSFAAVTYFFTGGAGAFDKLFIGAHLGLGALALIGYLSLGLENLREFLGERSTRYGANTALASVFFIGIVVVANYLGARYSYRFDLTEQNVYSLSPQSRQVLEELDGELHMQAFVEAGVNPQLRELLDSYRYASSKVRYEMIDPDRNPELAEKYGIRDYDTVRIEYDDKSTLVTAPNEEKITNAIIKVTRARDLVACFTDGHGEPSLDNPDDAHGLSLAKAALINENYEVRPILLATEAAVPEDCTVVVVAGPRRPFLSHEIELLRQFLRSGGRVLFLLPPRTAYEFEPFLKEWGVELGDDIVVDPVLRLFQGPALGLEPLVEHYGSHEITRELQRRRMRTLFPMTRSVRAADAKTGLDAVEIVRTGPSSWAETDLDGIFVRREAKLDADDRRGPVPIAVAVRADLKAMGAGDAQGEARLAAFGSVEWIDNRNLEGTFYNRDLFLNTIGWLAGQADLLSIRSRSLRASRISLSRDQGAVIFYLSVLILPELLLVAGLVVWWRRE